MSKAHFYIESVIDLIGNVISATNPLGRVTNYNYDRVN